jgi:methyltransferase (TIGR00027 family)
MTTAWRVALRRAAHQLLDRPPVLLDPLALTILGTETAEALRRNPGQFDDGPLAAPLRAFLAVRARLAEDRLAQLRQRGVRQYVVLGAGLDTSAYRNPRPDLPLRVWEVDQPAAQDWKRARLDAAGIEIPPGVSFVPLDFEHASLAEVLSAAGFDVAAGAFFSWLGVTPYLPRVAVLNTLADIAALTAPGGGVVFDYAVDPDLLTHVQRAVFHAMAARVEAAGEPWRSSFDPREFVATLRTIGFSSVEDFGADALNARYLANRSDDLRLGGLAHIMWAGSNELRSV